MAAPASFPCTFCHSVSAPASSPERSGAFPHPVGVSEAVQQSLACCPEEGSECHPHIEEGWVLAEELPGPGYSQVIVPSFKASKCQIGTSCGDEEVCTDRPSSLFLAGAC